MPLIAAACFALCCASAPAAILDVVADGDDLVFTWDTGAPDDLLRGTTPDDLRPWLPAVTSPHRVVGENALRGEHAFYRLASGSNMGFRIERTFIATPNPDSLWFVLRQGVHPTTMPERRVHLTARDLFSAWPALLEVVWWDALDIRWESAARHGALVIGDTDPLPRHGGVGLVFAQDTTTTLVGSHDDSYAGPSEADLKGVEPYETFWGTPPGPSARTNITVLPVPYHVRWSSAYELLCGERGVDWQDADADTLPDACGTDLDGDGTKDTGLWGGGVVMDQRLSLWVWDLPRGATLSCWRNPFRFDELCNGADATLDPSLGFTLQPNSYAVPVNAPFRPPTW